MNSGSEDIAARHPLIGRLLVLHLGLPKRDLHADVLVLGHELVPHLDVLVPHPENLTVGHLVELLLADDEVGRRDVRVAYAEWIETRRRAAKKFILRHNADDLLMLPEVGQRLLGRDRRRKCRK